MERLAVTAIAALCCLSPVRSQNAASPSTPTAEKLVPLFDGKSLDAFEQRGGKAKYDLEGGVITGTCVPSTPNSFLCTRKVYGDFALEYEFLVDGRLNSGVQIRSQSLPAYQRGRVHGYQIEIDPDVKRNRMWSGGIYDEARRGWLDDLKDNEPARKAFRPEAWNRIRVVAEGDSIRTWINGVAAADLVDSMTLAGFIGLQVHGVGKREEPMQVKWRNLRIADRGRHHWVSRFEGKSTKGWTAVGGGTWKIEKGVLVGRNTAEEPRHGLLLLDGRRGDSTFRLRFQAVAGNSGLYFRSRRIEAAGGAGIAGIQAEIDAAKDVGGLYETGGRQWITRPTDKQLKSFFKPGKWHQLTVSAHGRRIVVHVNNRRVSELLADPGPTEGLIALQLHGGQDVEVHFKDIEELVKAED